MEDYKQITTNTYDSIADKYVARDQDIFNITEQVNKDLNHFIKLLPAGGDILDIGVGGGRDSRFFLKHSFKVTAIDSSDKMIDAAKQSLPQARLLTMDFEEIDFPNASLDGVWADASLHHCPKDHLPKVFERIHQILRPSGHLFVRVKAGEGEGIRESMKFDQKIERYFAFYQPEELAKLARDAGFLVASVDLANQGEWLDLFAQKK